MHEKRHKQVAQQPVMTLEVEVRQPRQNCLIYAWDRDQGRLRLDGIQRAAPGLPADLAMLRLEGVVAWPTLLLTGSSIAPGTLVQARLLGALSALPLRQDDQIAPAGRWILVAVPELDPTFSAYHSLEMLPPAELAPLQSYVQAQTREEHDQFAGEVQQCDATEAARLIRDTRLLLKREKRAQPKSKPRFTRDGEERPVAWRAIEGLSASLRLQLAHDRALQADPNAPHAHAEQLIRYVPQRFQQALGDLLLDDERLLAFVERPLLRHRAGILGMQTWRANEGLFLVTDRQVLWLRDFQTPGTSFLPGGYIAHMAPLERLRNITIVPAGKTPSDFRGSLEPDDSPYQRLALEVTCRGGSEWLVVDFPPGLEQEKALARLTSILHAFLPCADGNADHRVRRLPVVEMWQPRGFEAEKLAALGGIVPAPIARRLEQRLTEELHTGGEELLAAALVPALEEYQSPARLIALTRQALAVISDTGGKRQRSAGEQVQRYDLAAVSSAQLRYSLLGSSLSLFVPRPDGGVQQQVFAFNSPAIARFLPLFTRLRLLLTGPYQT